LVRFFGCAGLSALLIAAPVVLPPSPVNAQVTTYSAKNHSDVTVVPIYDYAIPIPNTTILFGYDFTSRSQRDFVPFAQNLGFNVQVVGDLAGPSWSLSVYSPGNAQPVMEVSSKARISPLQGSSSQPLMCAWGPNKSATVLFFESDTPDALFPSSNNSDCGPAIFVQVSSQPGPDGAPAFSAFPNSPGAVLQNAQDAVKYVNSQLSSIQGAPQFVFAPPPSPLCTTITIVPASIDLIFGDAVAADVNVRTTSKDFETGPTHGVLKVRNDEILHAADISSGPLFEHELLHALGIGHSGQAFGRAPQNSKTDIMSLTGTLDGLNTAFLPLTADEKQAVAELYGSATITLSASQRQKYCRLYNPTAATAATGGGGGGAGSGSGSGSGGSGSCLMTCPSPFVVEPNSCSCVCGKTSSSCFPDSLDADQCQCVHVTHSFCFNSCPQGSFPDPSVNCQCVPEIGAQGGGGGGGDECDPTKQVDDSFFGDSFACGP
jgi:hypothetical protein